MSAVGSENASKVKFDNTENVEPAVRRSLFSSSSDYSSEASTATTSSYSTDDSVLIRQRKKLKYMLKSFSKSMDDGFLEGNFDEASETNVSATVGTSKLSSTDFRAYKNLNRLQIPIPPYKIELAPHRSSQPVEVLPIAQKKGSTSFKGILGQTTLGDKKKELQNRIKEAKLSENTAHKWKKYSQKKSKVKEVQYEPTYRIQPRLNLNISLIIHKVKPLFESLVKKHDRYDSECTPIFMLTACELIKNELKSVKLERYKVIVYMTILKKILSQSCLMSSTCLWNVEYDKEILMQCDTKALYANCVLYLIYKE